MNGSKSVYLLILSYLVFINSFMLKSSLEIIPWINYTLDSNF